MKEFALIGHPIAHSISADYFNSKFKTEEIDARYFTYDITSISKLPSLFIEHPNLVGFNVTSPYKTSIISYLTKQSNEALRVNAVNTVAICKNNEEKKELIGYNTDIEGFRKSIAPLLMPYHKRALILGTGGAAFAVADVFKKLKIDVIFISREKGKKDSITYPEIDSSILSKYLVIVNATPVGMSPQINICPPLPYNLLSNKHLCFDLIYAPHETLFLKKSLQYGATIKNGLEMLQIQAQESWKVWQKYL